MECTIGTTGFINYIMSTERTERKVKEAVEKYGTDIAIINGEDDWNCSNAFHIGSLLELFGIEQVGKFHNGVSGMTTSGAVIHKADLPTFITKYNKIKYNMMRKDASRPYARHDGQIEIYDFDKGCFKIFFKAEIDRNGLIRHVVNFKPMKAAN